MKCAAIDAITHHRSLMIAILWQRQRNGGNQRDGLTVVVCGFVPIVRILLVKSLHRVMDVAIENTVIVLINHVMSFARK